jgi:hypothetical protein
MAGVDFVIAYWYIRDLSATVEMTPPRRGGVPCGNWALSGLECAASPRFLGYARNDKVGWKAFGMGGQLHLLMFPDPFTTLLRAVASNGAG